MEPISKEDIDKFKEIIEISLNKLKKDVEHCQSKVPLDMVNISWNISTIIHDKGFGEDEEANFDKLINLAQQFEDDCICATIGEKLKEFTNERIKSSSQTQ